MNNFDERQALIRGKVFTHMYIIIVVLLFLNAILYSLGIIWADGFHSSILILMLATAIGSVEAIIRDVYFKSTRESFLAWFFAGNGTYLFISSVMHRNESYISGGELTNNGFSLILSIIFIIIGGSGIIKYLLSKRKERREEGEQ